MSLSMTPKSPLAKLYKKFSRKRSESSDQARSSISSNSSSGCIALNIEELRTVFDCIDTNSDGKVSVEELQSSVTLFGGALSSREAEQIVKISDVDGDGFIDFEEFLKLMEGDDGCGEEERRSELKEAFGMYVMDGEEFITAASLQRTLSRLGESRSIDCCRLMISGFDQNGDGVLSFDDFLLMMR